MKAASQEYNKWRVPVETIRVTDSSKYYSGRGNAPEESKGSKGVVSASGSSLDQESLSDHIDLSKGTQEALYEIQEEVNDLLKEHPEFAKHLPGIQDQVRLPGQIRAFVQNPYNQQLSNLNPHFRSFYKKVESIGAHLQQVMAKMREESRNSGATYHGLIG